MDITNVTKKRNVVWTEERRQAQRERMRKIGQQNQGKHFSKEHSENMSESMKKAYSKKKQARLNYWIKKANLFLTDNGIHYRVDYDLFCKVVNGLIDFETYDKSNLKIVMSTDPRAPA